MSQLNFVCYLVYFRMTKITIYTSTNTGFNVNVTLSAVQELLVQAQKNRT